MSWVLITVGSLLAVAVALIVVQALRKREYGKVVYQELDYSREGRLLKEKISVHPDDELRMQMTLMQIQILKNCYVNNIPPSVSARKIIDSLNEILGNERTESAEHSEFVDASGVAQSTRSNAAAPSYLERVRHCALAIMENANYITKELGNVQMEDADRTRAKEICQAQIGTSYGMLSDFSDFSVHGDSEVEHSGALDYAEHIMHELQDGITKLHQLVVDLDAQSKQNPERQIAFVLVSESSANILNAFGPALTAVQTMRSSMGDAS